jgi:hypothetical protein
MLCIQYKFHPVTGHEGPEGEQMYSSTLPLTSALDGVGGQHHALAALPPGKTWYPLYRRLGGGPRAGLDGCGKSRPPPGFDPRTVQPVASRYTDYVYNIYSFMFCSWLNKLYVLDDLCLSIIRAPLTPPSPRIIDSKILNAVAENISRISV